MEIRKIKPPSELIGKKVLFDGFEWKILREGLFVDSFDLSRPGHVYCDVHIKQLKFLHR